MSISGNTIAVGSVDINGNGKVYVFVKPASGWADTTETAVLTDSNPQVGFGYAVSISGNTVAAGVPTGSFGASAVDIFVEPAGGWANMTETAQLPVQGGSVAISGNTLVGGEVGGYAWPGSASVCLKPPGGWKSAPNCHSLMRSDGFVHDSFGSSVALIAGAAVVRGGGKYQNGPSAAYVFVKPVGGWTNMYETAKLTASDGGNLWYVAISGNKIVAGAQPFVYVFRKPLHGWKTTSHFNAKLAVPGETYYIPVAINGNTLVAGAPDATVGGNHSQGAAYVFGR